MSELVPHRCDEDAQIVGGPWKLKRVALNLKCKLPEIISLIFLLFPAMTHPF